MPLTYNLKPYAISKAIADLGAQETITNLLSAVNANLDAEGYTNPCPQCYSNGTITNAQAEVVECPICHGWGKTSVLVSSVRTFSPQPPSPTIELT